MDRKRQIYQLFLYLSNYYKCIYVVEILGVSERCKLAVNVWAWSTKQEIWLEEKNRKYIEMMRLKIAVHLVDNKRDVIKEKELDGAYK